MLHLSDPDVTLHHGDVLEVLRELPAESVDCVVTSPPYWGLRDYGTGAWEGGDAECDHRNESTVLGNTRRNLAQAANKADGGNRVAENRLDHEGGHFAQYRDTCGKCGATRIDQQLGLEPTPEQYVERMVEVFREVRRVLAGHGTCWLNLGDSYVSQGGSREGHAANTGQGSRRQAEPQGSRRATSGLTGGSVSSDVSAPGYLAAPGLKQKDLVGIPWRVAFALQADGWYLRSDIIWSKPNPMPESVTDRPTKAHEYVFLLSKQPRYFFDQEAVREKAEWARWGDQTNGKHQSGGGSASWIPDRKKGELQGGRHRRRYDAEEFKTTDERNTRFQGPSPADGGRNIRSVWEIATQPYPEAHFATFPEELARRAIAAGCPEQVCRVCGKARERVVGGVKYEPPVVAEGVRFVDATRQDKTRKLDGKSAAWREAQASRTTLGLTDCGHSDYRPGIVLDPFMGSGTVAYVARKLGRHSIGIDLSADYLELAARRLQQQSLFSEAAS